MKKTNAKMMISDIVNFKEKSKKSKKTGNSYESQADHSLPASGLCQTARPK
jgi:hypothetical protein